VKNLEDKNIGLESELKREVKGRGEIDNEMKRVKGEIEK
jgi:hypothetical protein